MATQLGKRYLCDTCGIEILCNNPGTGSVTGSDHERKGPAGAWVRGEGVDEVRLGRLPAALELDAAAPGHPVRLRHRSRHASVLSSSALHLLGGGPGIERRDGMPTGLVSGREAQLGRLIGRLPSDARADGL